MTIKMRTILKRLVGVITLVTLSISIIGCSLDKEEYPEASKQPVTTEKKEVKVACLPTIEPIVELIAEGLEPLGYDVKTVMFDANQLPATALKDGDVDGLVTNHLPWIKTFNEQNNCNLIMPKPYMYYGRTGVYSYKYKSIEELPENAQIAVPGDPSNLDKSLLTLRDIGLITLGEKVGEFYTLLDIKENTKNIKIIETEISTTIRSIKDVDAVICGATNIKKAGMDPNSFLYEDKTKVNYPIGLVINPKDREAQWVKEALKLSQTDEFRKKFNEQFDGTYILYDK